ncbi:phosphopantetheine-binding protein [Streptomyces sp. RB6PN25]|uniref:Phosphopantetheine-binding protein n=1 Tax=Streptomyces humicola TaxID=2953240 RepID=A0ABT1Q2Y2_9ACTN|nr:phosphopantetheine-binding protein [Streptomyces humicola]MCQ4084285.1 phosphopantetheine-binding protein [Streptomyces humicola]
MRGVGELISLVNEELGMALRPADADSPLGALPGWDSLLLLRLIAVLEAATGRPLPVADVISASSLAEIHALVAAE